jgi:D-alanyl-D-alanine carboxypeptidase
MNKSGKFWLLLVLAIAVVIGGAPDAFAARKAKKKAPPPLPHISKSANYAALVVNVDNGQTLLKQHASAKRYPASLVKMMTLYVTFEALKSKQIRFSQLLTTSARAAAQPKSNLSLKVNERINVQDAVYALIVKSANDVAVVLAEGIGGSEPRFVEIMNAKAKQLGMRNTNFVNASGLHNPYQYTTAYDMARLAIALRRDFPEYYHMFSKMSFVYKNRIISGHNGVLKQYKWSDGVKTGFTGPSGFNLVTSTNKPEAKLVGVVMGGKSAKQRDKHMVEILEYSYRNIKKHTIKSKRAQQKPKASGGARIKVTRGSSNNPFAIVQNEATIPSQNEVITSQENAAPMPEFTQLPDAPTPSRAPTNNAFAALEAATAPQLEREAGAE